MKQAAEASKGKSFEALPADRYNLVVESAEVKPTSTGNEMISVTFVVANGKYKNRKLWHNFNLGEKSLPFLVTFLRKAHLPDILEDDSVMPQEIAQRLEDVKISAYTEPGTTPNGAPKNELKNWGDYQVEEDDEDLPDFLKDDSGKMFK